MIIKLIEYYVTQAFNKFFQKHRLNKKEKHFDRIF